MIGIPSKDVIYRNNVSMEVDAVLFFNVANPRTPADVELRYLQTFTKIGDDQNSTVIVLMPIDIVKPFLALLEITADVKHNGHARLKVFRASAAHLPAQISQST